jgi:hypothetical protein
MYSSGGWSTDADPKFCEEVEPLLSENKVSPFGLIK